jgi:uncharacterized membrane protein YuzA (DUF378 family)
MERRRTLRKIDVTALALVIIGALNWGLVALGEFDLVAALFGLEFGETNPATRVAYGLVGLSALWVLARVRAILTLGRRERAFA